MRQAKVISARFSNPMGRSNGRAILSEVGTMALEYIRLWQITDNNDYYDVVSTRQPSPFLDLTS